jgi:flavin reductase (DIM6/NTAB) family NADH-FMN oxidoreductase RutF
VNFDMRKLEPKDRYKLLTGMVVPRPIALVTSLDPEGRINAAPYSFFNAMGSDPPIVALGPGRNKHTLANIRHTQEFVINMVSENIAHAMNITAIDFPQAKTNSSTQVCTLLPHIRSKRHASSRAQPTSNVV